MSDPDLIVRVLAHDDRAAFGQLVRNHQSAVRHFLRHLTRGDAALADDLAQETFLQAYQGLARFRGESSFSSWLLGIAHNQFRNARRRAATRQAEPLAEDSFSAGAVSSSAHATDLKHDVAAALTRLSPEQQTVLHLCYQQGLTHNEAAAVLDCPLGTVKTNIARAKEQLRESLAAWNPQT